MTLFKLYSLHRRTAATVINRQTPQPHHGHLRGTTTSIGSVDPELIDRAQPGGRWRRACRALPGVQRQAHMALEKDGSWAWALVVDGIYLRNCRGFGQELFIHILLLDIASSCVYVVALCLRFDWLQCFTQKRSQIGLDYFNRDSPNEPRTGADGSDFLDWPEGPTHWWPVACDLGPEWRSWVRIVYFFLNIRAQSSRRTP